MDGIMGRGIEVRAVAIDDWTGRSGAAAFVEDRQVSPVLADPAGVAAWLDDNRALVEGAVERGWDVPSHAALDHYGRSLAKALSDTARKLRKADADLKDYAAIVDRLAREGGDGERLADVRWLHEETRTLADALRQRQASIQGLRLRLAADPVSLFLPIGALVRMRAPARPESWVGGREAPPVPGSVGIVVGPTDAGVEWSTKVAFLRFTDTNGDSWSRSRGNPMTLGLDAADVEVVALGRYADGTPCRSIEFRATHRRDDRHGEEPREMVVESDGAAWLVTRRGEAGNAWVDVQGWEGLDDLDFLTPLDAAPGPRGP